VWDNAGPQRDPARLKKLLDDPYPLAKMIAGSALERRESRGAHRRSDLPLPDPALDGIHLVIEPSGTIRADRWI
jgi:L-aspartate oxidase